MTQWLLAEKMRYFQASDNFGAKVYFKSRRAPGNLFLPNHAVQVPTSFPGSFLFKHWLNSVPPIGRIFIFLLPVPSPIFFTRSLLTCSERLIFLSFYGEDNGTIIIKHSSFLCSFPGPGCSKCGLSPGQTHTTCCAQQCCDMLPWYVAIVWPGLNANPGLRVLMELFIFLV